MKKDRKIEIQADSPLAGYDKVLTDVVRLLESGRRAAAWSVNSIMTATYWMIGRRIVEFNQRGQGRAPYGNELIVRFLRTLRNATDRASDA